ncbi:prepilin peptidase [Paenibacillus sp. 598K]|uniref:A24 family peptidase n=1 Tax=Paenibacillus sp. 598K TaxID=1117987 RepID=UPI000FF94AD9|nr:A24 family peptidase [Paenibacillus sp. 598K]GBF76443.1 prepilin peptidase [Paenibacillus sp. 598K]
MAMTSMAALLIVATALITDIRAMRIPNVLTLTACVVGWLYQGIAAGWAGLGLALLGTAAGFAPLLLMYLLRGVGAGDVKLFGALGAWLGTAAVFELMCVSIILAGIIGLAVLICYRPFLSRCLNVLQGWMWLRVDGAGPSDDESRKRLRFPFMLAVAPAALICFVI